MDPPDPEPLDPPSEESCPPCPPCSSSSLALMPSSTSSLTSSSSTSSALPVAGFNRLQVSTNLNRPPENWLSGSHAHLRNLAGFYAQPTVRAPVPLPPFSSPFAAAAADFPSFQLASSCAAVLPECEVVSSAESIKKLLKLACSKQHHISLVVHRVANTLLLDDFDLHTFLLRNSREEWRWMRQLFLDVILHDIERKENALVRRNTKNYALQDRSLYSKFLHRSVEDDDQSQGLVDRIVGRITAEQPFDDGNKEKKNDERRRSIQRSMQHESATAPSAAPTSSPRLPSLPEDTSWTPFPSNKTNDPFARNVLWTFEDTKMLIGSDMPIFGDSEHPAVSLRLHDASRPINILTGLDYWLDNLICNVPEVLMCFHMEGFVKDYQFIKTEDLPRDSNFSPASVRDVARNILAFLKTNAVHEGHTYWLFKGKNEDYVKLYDLTELCEQNKPMDGSSASGQGGGAGRSETESSNESHGDKGVDGQQNPFRTAVSLLLYKMAKNLLQGPDRESEVGTARKLLENCLSLLDKELYPHIASSAHFMLSNLYVPEDINPQMPVFDSDPKHPRNRRHQSPQKSPKKKKTPKKNPSTSSAESGTSVVSSVSVEELKVPGFVDMMREEDPEFAGPEPLPAAAEERCERALLHVTEGLQLLDQLSKRRAEFAEKERKEQEWRERDSQRKPNPSEAIPMPYDDGKAKTKLHEGVVVTAKKARARSKSESAMQTVSRAPLSWHDELKALLLTKAFVTYITQSWTASDDGKFGTCLRKVKNALNCHQMVIAMSKDPLAKEKFFIRPMAFKSAGNTLIMISRNWDKLVTYQEEYNHQSDVDLDLADHISHHTDEEKRDWVIKFPATVEEAQLLGVKCFETGLSLVEGSSSVGQNASNATNPIFRQGHRELLELLCANLAELGASYVGQALLQISRPLQRPSKEDEDSSLSTHHLVVTRLVERGSELLTNALDRMEQLETMLGLQQRSETLQISAAEGLATCWRLQATARFNRGKAARCLVEVMSEQNQYEELIAHLRTSISEYEHCLYMLRKGLPVNTNIKQKQPQNRAPSSDQHQSDLGPLALHELGQVSFTLADALDAPEKWDDFEKGIRRRKMETGPVEEAYNVALKYCGEISSSRSMFGPEVLAANQQRYAAAESGLGRLNYSVAQESLKRAAEEEAQGRAGNKSKQLRLKSSEKQFRAADAFLARASSKRLQEGDVTGSPAFPLMAVRCHLERLQGLLGYVREAEKYRDLVGPSNLVKLCLPCLSIPQEASAILMNLFQTVQKTSSTDVDSSLLAHCSDTAKAMMTIVREVLGAVERLLESGSASSVHGCDKKTVHDLVTLSTRSLEKATSATFATTATTASTQQSLLSLRVLAEAVVRKMPTRDK